MLIARLRNRKTKKKLKFYLENVGLKRISKFNEKKDTIFFCFVSFSAQFQPNTTNHDERQWRGTNKPREHKKSTSKNTAPPRPMTFTVIYEDLWFSRWRTSFSAFSSCSFFSKFQSSDVITVESRLGKGVGKCSEIQNLWMFEKNFHFRQFIDICIR